MTAATDSTSADLLGEVTELAMALIAIPSLSGRPEPCGAALDVVSRRLEDVVRQGLVSEDRLSYAGADATAHQSRLWSAGADPRRPRWLLAGHVDVVDAAESWRPFEPRVDGGRLIGRGAGDMKGQVAVMVEVFRRWVAAGGTRGVALLLTSDEEIGGEQGAGAAIRAGLRPDWTFIPDGGNDFEIVRSQKAPHHFRVTVKGVGGHASRAFELDNPLNRLVALYGDLRSRYSLADSRNSWASTLEMTQVQSEGSSVNAIPGECSAWFSWRFPPEQLDFTCEWQRIRQLCAEHGGEVTAEHGVGKGCHTDLDEPAVQQWKHTIQSILGRPVALVNAHGASDARHFAAVGTKVLMTNPRVGNLHANDEWVELKSLVQLTQGLERFLGEIGRADAAAVPAADG